MNLKESYENTYGENLTWDNLERFMFRLVKEQQNSIADKYVETTTTLKGDFTGDKRIAEMISTTPLKYN